MKDLVRIALTATLVAGAAASAHHRHLHAKRHEHAVHAEKRDVVTTVVQGPTATVYVMDDGAAVDVKEAKDCIANGGCDIIGSTVPTFTPPPVPSPSPLAAQFFESKILPSPSPSPSPSPAQPSPVAPVGIDTPFPDGVIDCTKAPTQYGAVDMYWLNREGWAGRQKPSSRWVKDVPVAVPIHQQTKGGCEDGEFCAIGCPSGYMSTQWPTTSQPENGISLGGLYCNGGKLYKTNPDFDVLCTPGAGGIEVRNELPDPVCICKTIYPGSESPDEPHCIPPNGTIPLLNIDALKGYRWQGKTTTGQFYVNNRGIGVEDACVWESKLFPLTTGNWSPINIGAGRNEKGETFLSIFKNLPTSHAPLDFNIIIKGDVSSKCFVNDNGFPSGNGCTTAITRPGGKATIVLQAGAI